MDFGTVDDDAPRWVGNNESVGGTLAVEALFGG